MPRSYPLDPPFSHMNPAAIPAPKGPELDLHADFKHCQSSDRDFCAIAALFPPYDPASLPLCPLGAPYRSFSPI
ncbi:hypothetical protein M3J09_006987 [Ascochyta lentis]